jgi:hypothetical protein
MKILTRSQLHDHFLHLRDRNFIGCHLDSSSGVTLRNIIEKVLELLFSMILVELHIIHTTFEFLKHQCATHPAVLVEDLFISLLFSDLLNLHYI